MKTKANCNKIRGCPAGWSLKRRQPTPSIRDSPANSNIDYNYVAGGCTAPCRPKKKIYLGTTHDQQLSVLFLRYGLKKNQTHLLYERCRFFIKINKDDN